MTCTSKENPATNLSFKLMKKKKITLLTFDYANFKIK